MHRLHISLAIFLRPRISLGKAFRLLRALNQSSIASHQLFHQGRTKVPLCSAGLCPLRGRCPASPHSNSQSGKAGQRVSLTTYCPWATCFFFFFVSSFWAAAPKGRCPVGHRGEFPYVHPYVRTSVRPPPRSFSILKFPLIYKGK